MPDIALTYKRCGQCAWRAWELTQESAAALGEFRGRVISPSMARNPIILPVSFKGLGEPWKPA